MSEAKFAKFLLKETWRTLYSVLNMIGYSSIEKAVRNPHMPKHDKKVNERGVERDKES